MEAPVQLSKSQFKVLKKLTEGWYMDGCGKEGLGGWCWTDGRRGFRVTISDMNFLYCQALIEHGELFTYQISAAGQEAVKAHLA